MSSTIRERLKALETEATILRLRKKVNDAAKTDPGTRDSEGHL